MTIVKGDVVFRTWKPIKRWTGEACLRNGALRPRMALRSYGHQTSYTAMRTVMQWAEKLGWCGKTPKRIPGC